MNGEEREALYSVINGIYKPGSDALNWERRNLGSPKDHGAQLLLGLIEDAIFEDKDRHGSAASILTALDRILADLKGTRDSLCRVLSNENEQEDMDGVGQ